MRWYKWKLWRLAWDFNPWSLNCDRFSLLERDRWYIWIALTRHLRWRLRPDDQSRIKEPPNDRLN